MHLNKRKISLIRISSYPYTNINNFLIFFVNSFILSCSDINKRGLNFSSYKSNVLKLFMQKLFRIKNTGFSLNIQSQVGLKDDDKFNEVSWTYSNMNYTNTNSKFWIHLLDFFYNKFQAHFFLNDHHLNYFIQWLWQIIGKNCWL